MNKSNIEDLSYFKGTMNCQRKRHANSDRKNVHVFMRKKYNKLCHRK